MYGDFGLEMLYMRRALIIGKENSCNGRKNFGSCLKARKAAASINSVNQQNDKALFGFQKKHPYPCPFCEGDFMELPNGQISSFKERGWHLNEEIPLKELEEFCGITHKEAVKSGYPISDKSLKESIEIYANENLFERFSPRELVDPKTRIVFQKAHDAYFQLKRHLGID